MPTIKLIPLQSLDPLRVSVLIRENDTLPAVKFISDILRPLLQRFGESYVFDIGGYRFSSLDELKVDVFQNKLLAEPKMGPALFSALCQTPKISELTAETLMTALQDDEIQAIWLLTSGEYHTLFVTDLEIGRIIKHSYKIALERGISVENFRQKPVVGYCGVAALLGSLAARGLCRGIHGPHAQDMSGLEESSLVDDQVLSLKSVFDQNYDVLSIEGLVAENNPARDFVNRNSPTSVTVFGGLLQSVYGFLKATLDAEEGSSTPIISGKPLALIFEQLDMGNEEMLVKRLAAEIKKGRLNIAFVCLGYSVTPSNPVALTTPSKVEMMKQFCAALNIPLYSGLRVGHSSRTERAVQTIIPFGIANATVLSDGVQFSLNLSYQRITLATPIEKFPFWSDEKDSPRYFTPMDIAPSITRDSLKEWSREQVKPTSAEALKIIQFIPINTIKSYTDIQDRMREHKKAERWLGADKTEVISEFASLIRHVKTTFPGYHFAIENHSFLDIAKIESELTQPEIGMSLFKAFILDPIECEFVADSIVKAIVDPNVRIIWFDEKGEVDPHDLRMPLILNYLGEKLKKKDLSSLGPKAIVGGNYALPIMLTLSALGIACGFHGPAIQHCHTLSVDHRANLLAMSEGRPVGDESLVFDGLKAINQIAKDMQDNQMTATVIRGNLRDIYLTIMLAIHQEDKMSNQYPIISGKPLILFVVLQETSGKEDKLMEALMAEIEACVANGRVVIKAICTEENDWPAVGTDYHQTKITAFLDHWSQGGVHPIPVFSLSHLSMLTRLHQLSQSTLTPLGAATVTLKKDPANCLNVSYHAVDPMVWGFAATRANRSFWVTEEVRTGVHRDTAPYTDFKYL